MEATTQKAEKDWHEALFGGRVRNNLVVPDAIRHRYLHPPARPRFYLEKAYQLLGNMKDKRVLVFGCGDDSGTVILALQRADVFAFDLSEEAILIQNGMAVANHVANNVHSIVCAAEEMPFREGAFDAVLGMAILHHIPNHLGAVPVHLSHVLRKGGKAVFIEPVIRSRAFGRILEHLPGRQDISPGERQLTEADLAAFEQHFKANRHYFCLFSRLDRFICKGPLETASWWRRLSVNTLHAIDQAVLLIPGMDKFAGVVVLELEKR